MKETMDIEHDDDVTVEAVDEMRKRAQGVIGAEEWVVVDGFGSPSQMREVSISHRIRANALEEALKTVLASLVATTSLIIRAEDLKVKPSKAVASDKMFTQMLKDYDKATIAGRAALSAAPEPDGIATAALAKAEESP